MASAFHPLDISRTAGERIKAPDCGEPPDGVAPITLLPRCVPATAGSHLRALGVIDKTQPTPMIILLARHDRFDKRSNVGGDVVHILHRSTRITKPGLFVPNGNTASTRPFPSRSLRRPTWIILNNRTLSGMIHQFEPVRWRAPPVPSKP